MFEFYHETCGHYLATHEDHDYDLINASEKEIKKEENKMKHPQEICNFKENNILPSTDLFLNKDCVDCQEIAKKLPNNQSAKHECGKVFDREKAFKRNDGQEIKKVEMSKSFIIVEFQDSVIPYFNCGHAYEHIDWPGDLINLPEETKEEMGSGYTVQGVVKEIVEDLMALKNNVAISARLSPAIETDIFWSGIDQLITKWENK